VKEIFLAASDTPADRRSAALAQLCGGDAALCCEVEKLLVLRDENNLALDRPAPFERPRYQTGELLADRYRITKFVASGGMGEVYAADDLETGRLVALKCIRNLALDGNAEARLLREVRMAGAIEHPSVCRIYALEHHGADRFFVMELLEGEPLSERLASRRRFSAGEALPIVRQVIDGLEAAHRAGVLHRDLKPANIMLSSDRAVIIDFGLAAAIPDRLDASRSLTATGALIGTLAYIAPEQLEGARSTPASDLYSLGVIVYEMLTGVKPHDAKSPFQLAAQKVRESHLNAAFKSSDLPLVWREAIVRCLKPKPEERFQSAAELRELLDRGKATAAFRFAGWRRRLHFAAAAMLAIVLAWFGWTWAQQDRVPPPQVAQLYADAQSALNAQASMRAVKLLERVADLDPRFVKARSMLAAAYVDLDQPDKARDAMLKATAAADDRWLLGRGERQALAAARAVVMRDYKLAAERYGRVALSSRGAERSQALVVKARMLEHAGQIDSARATVEIALREDPRNSPARVRLALLLCLKRDYARAAAEFHRAEVAYQKEGNLEGLSDLLLARFGNLRSQTDEEERQDLARVLDLSRKTGNLYHQLSAKFQMARIAERERDYDRAIAVTREAAQQATREGMPEVAARAMAELGYAFGYAKKWHDAVLMLGEALELAKRAGSPATVASIQLKLGEALSNDGQTRQAVETMEPAVAWYRQNSPQAPSALMLIKWGTVLNGTARFDETAGAFREALDVATRTGDEMYQSLALQRLASFYATRDLRQSVQYWDRSIVLARKTHLTGALLQAAVTWQQLGEFGRAADLIAEAERDLAANYGPGVDRDNLTNYALWTRTWGEYLQNRCAEALRLGGSLTPRGLPDEILVRRLQLCAGSLNTSGLRRNLAWFDARLTRQGPEQVHLICRLSAAAGETALVLHDWRTAKRHAERGIQAASAGRHTIYELDNLLVLRAAQQGLGDTDAVDRLTHQVLDTAAKVGFNPPDHFGGRHDLLRLWSLAPSSATSQGI
jgi:tetratricopeptide (TPR) repeat protein